jgi:YbbR domain-containing protein
VGYKILAVCLAFLLWYFVTGQLDPMAKQTFTRPVELRPTVTQLVSMTSLPEVTITVSGAKSLVQSLQEQDIHAYVDVSGQTTGVRYLPIQTGVPDNIRVLSIYPQTVRVSLDYLANKKVPVKVVLQGTPISGFMTLDPVATPGQVTVSGPSGLLGGIQEVQAVVNAAGVNTNITTKVSLQFSEPNDKLEMNPKEVSVVVPVVPSEPVKTVPVIADVSGTPGPNLAVKSVVVEPAMVELTGPQDVLAGLVTVYTQPVDISGATDPVVQNVDLMLPQGVFLVTQGQVQVTVELGAAATGAPPQPGQ